MTIHEIARALVRDGKGIFTADEGLKSGGSLFTLHGIPMDEESYRAYREILLTTPGIERFLSGIVLPQEALEQKDAEENVFHESVSSKDIALGVNLESMDTPEKLAEDIRALRSLSVTFLKYKIRTEVPFAPVADQYKESIRQAVEFSKTCQAESVMPMIEVDVSMSGPHTSAQAEDALVEALSLLSDALESGNVDLQGVIVETSMAATGTENPLRSAPSEVAERTVRAATSSLPERLAGVVFLSELQKPEEATANLNAIARLEPFPWPMTFSFSDAFENPVLAAWGGKEENVPAAQAAFLERLSLAEAADSAGYSSGMEEDGFK